MEYNAIIILILSITSILCEPTENDNISTLRMSREERIQLREEARKMVYHAYHAYMDNAYPADELMPLSCQGRYRGVTPSRGDMDDALGNFSLTLVDSLDTFVVIGDFAEFSRALKLVIKDVTFDHDIVVSVFETNIRMLGGLLSAHILAMQLKPEISTLSWYAGELLAMAEDLGRRLLPAFNTTTGIPHGRINLRHGLLNLSESRETCTACAGTMILEMAALSRLTGNPVFEQKAHKAMDRLWKIRHRTSDLMGTVINIHSGDWVRKDSGIGAGIDSYYEYCLKAYILLGDEKYLARFNRHYNAIMKYVSRGPIMLDVHMHRPHLQSRNFMDALLAFWPGLQVLLGDVRPAVETHEMLYQVMQRHTFIPDAFTSDFQVHWANHPLRPEFIESTYFLHRATGDDHYLYVGKAAMKALQQYTRVACGYAAVNDVRTKLHEDRMDSFVLSETFKYLYMLFGYDKDLPIKLDDYVLTTEAHFLPLTLAGIGKNATVDLTEEVDEDKFKKTCPNTVSLLPEKVRRPLRSLVGDVGYNSRPIAQFFTPSDPRQVGALSEMGIQVLSLTDGRIQLLYTTSTAKSPKEATEGLTFMREMSKWTEVSESTNNVKPVGVMFSEYVLEGGPAHFGTDFTDDYRVIGKICYAAPIDACTKLTNADEVYDKIGVSTRGECTFAQKVRNLKKAGAIAAIIVDNVPGTSNKDSPMFAMSGDGQNDIDIPAVFLFSKEAETLSISYQFNRNMDVTISSFNALKMPKGPCSPGETCNTIASVHPDDASQASFEHLKKVLGRLVAQVELSLANEENISNSQGECTEDTVDDDIVVPNRLSVLTHDKKLQVLNGIPFSEDYTDRIITSENIEQNTSNKNKALSDNS